MLGVRKGSNFQSAHEILHFRDDSVRVSLKVEQHFCLSKLYLSLLLFAVLILSQMDFLGYFSSKGACYIHKLQCITEQRSKALTVLENLNEQVICVWYLPPHCYSVLM